MYTDLTTDKTYPKTLIIRNHHGGLIWQIYHVEAQHEAEQISDNATRNAFYAITLEDYQPERKESWPNWRKTKAGKRIIENKNYIKV